MIDLEAAAEAIAETDPSLFYASTHQYPFYPGTGSAREQGIDGNVVNVPLPAGSGGEEFRTAWADRILPALDRFAPELLIISAGFDAHRDDPITDLGLSAGDYHLITERLLHFAPTGRRLVMLEGGYDLDALRHGSAAALAALMGRVHRPEPPTSGGPGQHVASGVQEFWVEHGLL